MDSFFFFFGLVRPHQGGTAVGAERLESRVSGQYFTHAIHISICKVHRSNLSKFKTVFRNYTRNIAYLSLQYGSKSSFVIEIEI